MAGKQIDSGLQEEVTCPICRDILKEPVTIDCGHNFCLGCIIRGGEADEPLLCPLCKALVNRSTFKPNKLLANLVKKVWITASVAPQPEDGELRCKAHREKFQYFCEEDGKFLCLVCRDSNDHRFHNVSLIEEAAQKYQEQIQAQLQVLGQKDKEIVEEKEQGEGMISVFKARTHLERLKIHQQFKHLRKRLEEEENFLLDRLLGLEQEGDKLRERYGTVTAEQLSYLREITESLRAREQMSPLNLLQGIKVTLSRNQGFQFNNPTPVPVDLWDRINEASSRHESTIERLQKFKENLDADRKKDEGTVTENPEVDRKKDEGTVTESMKSEDVDNCQKIPCSGIGSPLPPSPVTLNAASADPDLSVSPDLRKVSLDLARRSPGNKQAKPRPFYPFHCVLGSQGLTSGRQVWEAELQGTEGGVCVVGVATELDPGLHSKNHIWALKVSASTCLPITENSFRQNIPIRLNKVGIYLDCDSGEVVFFDPATNKHIYTFKDSFAATIFPFFALLKPVSSITLSP